MMESYQRAREEVIIRQQTEISELSTPVVKLWHGILALPLIGTLDYGPIRVAPGPRGFKHRAVDHVAVKASMLQPGYLLKIIPHVDGSPRICELVRYMLGDITVKGAWTGPAALDLHPHALAPVADLPVLEVVSATHILADLTLELGTVVHDYLAA